MKRKQAILGILGVVAGTAAAYSGWQWYYLRRKPDLRELPTFKSTVDALAETIIPATPGVPGAREAKVGDFILTMIRDATPPMEQNKFLEGLRVVERKSQTRFQKNYASLNNIQQKEILEQVIQNQHDFKGLIGKVQTRLIGKSFFQQLKTLTVTGYCTSELGAQKGLAYQYLPGSYQGCAPLSPQQKAWSTK